ncbi:carbamoyltransferase HypF [Methanotorris formicicus]|uniref:Carbamoyltransferase n=1 Tax=Methanotorris formicicus Mc-S-70 TaxID=647171 RepID=H1L000_9EURY|nr:carbamoyltransferase HypF [Methanotorris formicicus]EHP85410.1 (NiFe) hydrogenase maturation protein HypF [Methanotorris formicicus Mc-S-70]
MDFIKIHVKGIVQGVGFRPFVYRIAKENNLKGYVKNMGNYVEIVVGGKKEDIEKFIDDLKSKKPPLSKIDDLKIKLNELKLHFDDFVILNSEETDREEEGTIPADVAICEECLKEMVDKNDRRYRYPFIACTNCGPRFTVIEKVPYDRENTSMRDFPLCEVCLEEYKNPLDRRFHAQATCCPKCGPKVFLTDENGEVLYEKDEAINEAIKLLEGGKILAVKGIGGTHLVCKVNDDEVVLTLRKMLGRPSQPFAVMSKLEYLSLFAEYGDEELETLISPRRPIVVLKKNDDYNKYFSKYVSNLDTIGVMLPYSGLHYLLFDKEIAYIMTSANLPGLPMVKDNDEILKKLKGIADYFLLHNRRIINRCDDSVMKKINNRMIFLRRSRGFAPEPIEVKINNSKNILCVGGELNSTACLVKKNKFYLTQYIGNTSKYETFCYLKDAINNLIKITNTNKIDVVVCDMHPLFNSTKFAEELASKGIELFRIQHHHAHVFSLMGDNNYFDDCIIIALDGVGYGLDGNIWGGEIFAWKNNEMKRIGHLEEQYQLGGDLATKYPLRMLLGILYKKIGEEAIDIIKEYKFFSDKELKIFSLQLEKKINCPITTSCGRVLDAISSLLSVTFEKTYDGEPAIRLEALASEFIKRKRIDIEVNPKIKNDILNTTDLIYNCHEMLKNGVDRGYIAYYAHIYIADGLSKTAIKNAEKLGIDCIGLSGGVSYNKIISERIRENVENHGFKFLYHKNVSNGDGGLSFGQGVGYILMNSQ